MIFLNQDWKCRKTRQHGGLKGYRWYVGLSVMLVCTGFGFFFVCRSGFNTGMVMQQERDSELQALLSPPENLYGLSVEKQIDRLLSIEVVLSWQPPGLAESEFYTGDITYRENNYEVSGAVSEGLITDLEIKTIASVDILAKIEEFIEKSMNSDRIQVLKDISFGDLSMFCASYGDSVINVQIGPEYIVLKRVLFVNQT